MFVNDVCSYFVLFFIFFSFFRLRVALDNGHMFAMFKRLAGERLPGGHLTTRNAMPCGTISNFTDDSI